MNILSNIIAQGAQKPTESQEVNKLAAKNGKQGMGQKFTQLMMGFLGINSTNSSNETIDTQVPAKENAEQSSVKSADGKSKENEALAGLFIGSHFVTMKTVQNNNDIAVESSRDQPSDKQSTIKTAASVLKDLSPEAENANVSSGEAETNTVQEKQSTGKAGKGNNTENSLVNTEEAQKVTTSAEKENSNSAAEVQGAVNGKEVSSTDQQKAASSTKKAPVKTQSPVKNGTQSAAEPEGAPKKGLNLKAPEAQADDVQAKQKQDANTQQVSAKTTKTQKAGDQKTADKRTPEFKQLMNQTEGKINFSEGKKAQTKAPQKMNADTKAHSSLKSELTHTASRLATAESEKILFNPIKQNSSTFELDPSKLINVESSGSGGIEMELQTGTDGDTSAKDDGKASIKFGTSGFSQLHNTNGRREFSTQLVRQLQQSENGNSESAKSWNHHRFVMDDGKSLNVSVRHAQGAMHLQLSAGDTQLNKIIQQHIDEIRQHLQEQMNVEINLELQHFGGQQAGQEKGNSQSMTQNSGNRLGITTRQIAGTNDQAPVRTARYLGFNTNEWTA